MYIGLSFGKSIINKSVYMFDSMENVFFSYVNIYIDNYLIFITT